MALETPDPIVTETAAPAETAPVVESPTLTEAAATPETPAKPVEGAAKRSALTATIAEKLRNLDPDSPDIAPADETKTEKSETTAAPGAVADPEAPTLTDAQRRSLIAYGWKPEQIDESLTLLGDRFVATAATIHQNRNAELTRFAEAGRAARPKPEQQAPAAGAAPLIQPIDVDALRKEHGNDPVVDQIVARLNPAIQAINAIVPHLQQGQKAVRDAEVAHARQQIDGFFGTPSMAPYATLYGDGKSAMTPEQVQNRNRVLEAADAIIAGARMQGRVLSVAEALTHGHDICAGDFKTAAVRSQIKTEAKARGAALLTKPTSRTASAPAATSTAREAKIGAALRKVFAS